MLKITKTIIFTLILFSSIGNAESSELQETVDINGEKYTSVAPWDMEKQYGTYYVDRLECAKKECGKALFFHQEKRCPPIVYIIDFESKEYNSYILYRQSLYVKGIELKRYLKTSQETYSVLKSTKNPNQYNFEDPKDPNNKENIYYYVEPFNTASSVLFINKFFIGKYIDTLSFNTKGLKQKGFTENPNIRIKNKKSYLQDKEYLQNFINKYHLNNIIRPYNQKGWYPDTGNTNMNITGKGIVDFRSTQYRLSISGTFNNGTLISNGKIFVRTWFSDGSIHMFQPNTTKEVNITPTTNIKQKILDIYKALNIQVSNIISEKKIQKSQSYSNLSSSGKTTLSCKYSCISDVGILYETYNNVGTIKVTGSSYSNAKNKALDLASKMCKKSTDKHGYKMRGDSVSCD